MAHTINVNDLKNHRTMLLNNYRNELDRMQSRLDGAIQRYDLGVHPEGQGSWSPTHHHDAYNMSSVCQELQRLASQIDMVDTVLRSVVVVE